MLVDEQPLLPGPVPRPARRVKCRRCGHPVAAGRDINGYGEDCAAILGLTVATPRVRADPQTGPDLFTTAPEADEPGDHCDA